MQKHEIERIFDRAKHEVERCKHEALALLCSEPSPSSASPQALPVWMDKEELAQYWKVSPETLAKWIKRKPNKHPLPYARMGDLLRFKREDCDRWAYEEREIGNTIKDETPVEKETQRRGLTAVAPPQGGQ